jgi:hypothetical protein
VERPSPVWTILFSNINTLPTCVKTSSAFTFIYYEYKFIVARDFTLQVAYSCIAINYFTVHFITSSSHGSTAQLGPWPFLMGFRNNNLFTGLDC